MGDQQAEPDHSGGVLDLAWAIPDGIALSEDHLSLTCDSWKPPGLFGVPQARFEEGRRAVASRPVMLNSFMALAGDPERTLRFAKRWGLLGLCEHRLPADHRSHHRLWMIHMATAEYRLADDGSIGERGLTEADREWRNALPDPTPCRPQVSERLEDWWFWARQAGAVIGVARSLASRTPVSAAVMSSIVDLTPMYVPTLRPGRVLVAEDEPERARLDILGDQNAFVA